tara:strand:+ start:306 stop:650 length:345 start_codon:yes stop_codon:yes gene_type:complete
MTGIEHTVNFGIIDVKKEHRKILLNILFEDNVIKLLFHENPFKDSMMKEFNSSMKNNGENSWESLIVKLEDLNDFEWEKQFEQKKEEFDNVNEIDFITLNYGFEEYFKLIGISY